MALQCSICRLTDNETEFGNDRRCRSCNRERQRQRRKNPKARELDNERTRAYHAKRRVEDPEFRQKANERAKRWVQEHPERRKANLSRWNQANPDRTSAYWHKRRALKRATQVELIVPSVVFERDGYICYLCNETTDPDGPRGRKPSIDHVVPLARGGPHIMENLRCAHISCNCSKGAKEWTP